MERVRLAPLGSWLTRDGQRQTPGPSPLQRQCAVSGALGRAGEAFIQ